MCALRYNAATVTPHSEKLTRILSPSLKVDPSPVSLHLYTVSPPFPQMKPGAHNTAFVFLRLASIPILRNIDTFIVNEY